MRISYYCQHVLGIGHLHRSLEICKAIAVGHDITLILGGPEASIDPEGIKILHLPGLKMDQNFQKMREKNSLSPISHNISRTFSLQNSIPLAEKHSDLSWSLCFQAYKMVLFRPVDAIAVFGIFWWKNSKAEKNLNGGW